MRRNGFTLIELLVVVAIIALLVSILLPALGSAFALHESEKDGMYPKPIRSGYVGGSPHVHTERYWWTVLLSEGYLPSTSLVWCPGDRRIQPSERYYNQTDETGRLPLVPKGLDPAQGENWIGYNATSYNPMGNFVPWNMNIFMDIEMEWSVDKKVTGNRADEVFLFDGIHDVSQGLIGFTFEDWVAKMPDDHRDHPDGIMERVGAGLSSPWEGVPNKWNGLSLRHGIATNALYFDSHAATIDGKDFWEADPGDPECMWDAQ